MVQNGHVNLSGCVFLRIFRRVYMGPMECPARRCGGEGDSPQPFVLTFIQRFLSNVKEFTFSVADSSRKNTVNNKQLEHKIEKIGWRPTFANYFSV